MSNTSIQSAFGQGVRPDLMSESDFDAAYRLFVDAVAMLAAIPLEQCVDMRDFDGAWELKANVQAGKYLAGTGYLSENQESWVLALAGALDAVTAVKLPAGSGRRAKLAAMNRSSWIPLRRIAAQVLDLLSPLTELQRGSGSS